MAGGPLIKGNTQSKYYPFNGGLDVVTPALSVDPGFALAMVNYEPFYNGGYRRIDGYERFDGHAKPSLGTSYGVVMSSLSGITGVGTSTTTNPNAYQAGTGVTSGATCIVIAATTDSSGTSWIGITNVSGTFTNGEKVVVGTTTSTGTIVVAPSASFGPPGTGTDGYLYTSEFLAGAQNYYRQQISAVPGTGNVLGAWQRGTNIYAIRGTSTTSALLWRSSAGGWSTAGISYGISLYYQGLLNSVQSSQFTATLDTNGVLNVTAMANGTIYVGATLADNAGLTPIGATIISTLGTATGQTGQYQISVSPSIPVASETMLTLNPAAQLPTVGQVVVGATSSATGTVAYAIPHDTTVGYLVFSTATYPGGTATFVSGELLKTVIGGTGTVWGTAASNGTAFSLPPTGFYRFKNSNFYATSATYNTYACNGKGPAFQIDNNQLVVPILMPLTQQPGQPGNGVWPFLIEAHAGYLFLAFPGGIYQQSVQGSPLQFDGFLGAAEFSTGDEITGMISTLGPNLVLPTVHATYALAGNTDADFVQTLIAEKAGMILYSGQLLDTVYALNNLGITSLSRTQSYGNFVGSTVSQLVQPIVTALRNHFTDSTIVRASNQARFYFDDGTCLIMYVPGLGQQNKAWSAIESGVTAQFGYASYPHPVLCAYNSEDQNDLEVGYFAFNNSDGYVYQDRSGASFDGAAVTSYVRLAFNNVGSPALRKYFRRLDLELNSTAQVALKFAADFSYNSESASSAVTNITANDIPAITVFGGGGYWNSVYWNQFLWDGQTISSARAVINGTGLNVSFLIFHQAIVDNPFVLQGATIYYDPRRLQR
jgi:hypothetical protein